MVKRLMIMLFATPLALGLAGSPAQADPTCPEGNFCSWTGYSYTGQRVLINERQLVPLGGCALIDTNNRVIVFRSFKNRIRGSALAPAWPIASVPPGGCVTTAVLRYGNDLPRVRPFQNHPDYVRHYYRPRIVPTG